MLKEYNFNKEQIEKIFKSKTKAAAFVLKYIKNPSRKNPTRKKVIGDLLDPYSDILNQFWSPEEFRDKCIEFVTTEEGKYVENNINGKKANNLSEAIEYGNEILKNLLELRSKERKEYIEEGHTKIFHLDEGKTDICLPDNFSDTITKRLARESLKYSYNSPERKNIDLANEKLAKIHKIEREIAQCAGDISELCFLQATMSHLTSLVFPTFSHSVGEDFRLYDKNAKNFSSLDVKTSRWPKHFSNNEKRYSKPILSRSDAMSRPHEAIQRLYESQGEERFSSKPRLYLVRTPPGETPVPFESILEQLDKKHDITFEYKGKIYSVEGAVIIFL